MLYTETLRIFIVELGDKNLLNEQEFWKSWIWKTFDKKSLANDPDKPKIQKEHTMYNSSAM